MNKSNTYKIKRTIPTEQIRQDIFVAIITFAEAFGYKAKKTNSLAKLKKGNIFTNIYSKKTAREIRIDGKMYYGFPPSENPQSLMKSPLMTIKDIDDMSMDY